MCFIDILGNLVPCIPCQARMSIGTIPGQFFTSRWSRCSFVQDLKDTDFPQKLLGDLAGNAFTTWDSRVICSPKKIPKRLTRNSAKVQRNCYAMSSCHRTHCTFFICLLPRTVCAANLIAILSCSGLLRDRWQSWRVGQSWGVRQSDVSLKML